MIEATTVLKVDSIYPFVAERHVKGWAGSGFVQQITTVKVRRVSLDNAEHVQCEIEIAEFKGKGERLYRTSGSLTLTPFQADALVTALQTVKVSR